MIRERRRGEIEQRDENHDKMGTQRSRNRATGLHLHMVTDERTEGRRTRTHSVRRMMLLGSASSIFLASPFPFVLLPLRDLPPPKKASNAASAASDVSPRPEADEADDGVVEVTSMLSLEAIVWIALGGGGAGST